MNGAVAIIQARMGSSRLPGKVMEEISGIPAIGWVVRAARAIPGIDRICVATSREGGDNVIADWCHQNDVVCHRGAENDVLERFAEASRAEQAEIVMRLTCDCPFLDPQVCGQVLMLFHRTGAGFASNANPWTWPDGLDCEVFGAEALYAADREATRPADREHVTPFLRCRPKRFPSENLVCPIPGLNRDRWTLDTAADLELIRAIAEKIPPGVPASYVDVLRVLDAEPELRKVNSAGSSAEAVDPITATSAIDLNRGFAESQRSLERAQQKIPLGSQTFSKSYQQYPTGAAPHFLTHGQGGRVWDVDGNEYVDMVCGLLSVVLGYGDPDVDQAIRHQISAGISFSLATELEAELAERLVEIVPCAEQVRFGKNGTDATSAAIRLSRAKTGRDLIAICGYHGWQDWYVGATTRKKGVPDAVSALTHSFPYNDIDALQALLSRHPGEFAAVIMEPMNIENPQDGYLGAVRELVHRHGSLLVFDETITGFRFSLGGAQELFSVTPDLASFGKGMGNGMPISAIVGRAEVMAEMDNVFLSSTFGGEALSIAAAIAVIDKMRREPVIETIWRTGRKLSEGVENVIAEYGLDDVIGLAGHPPWRLLTFQDSRSVPAAKVRTLFLREMLRAGVLIVGSHNICLSHSPTDIGLVLNAYRHSLAQLAAALSENDFDRHLPEGPIVPVFSVR